MEDDDNELAPIQYEIASYLTEAHEIMPYVLPNGVLGLHFLNLSVSIDTELTLFSEIEETSIEMESAAASSETSEVYEVYKEYMSTWQATLRQLLEKVDTVVAKLNTI
jgi:hypothetical protein